MRHVVSEPRPGSVVSLHAGDWLEVQLSHARPGYDWEVVAQPGCLFPISVPPAAERPSVLPTGLRHRSHGFLAFAAPPGSAQFLRFALVHLRHPDPAEVRELSVVVS